MLSIPCSRTAATCGRRAARSSSARAERWTRRGARLVDEAGHHVGGARGQLDLVEPLAGQVLDRAEPAGHEEGGAGGPRIEAPLVAVGIGAVAAPHSVPSSTSRAITAGAKLRLAAVPSSRTSTGPLLPDGIERHPSQPVVGREGVSVATQVIRSGRSERCDDHDHHRPDRVERGGRCGPRRLAPSASSGSRDPAGRCAVAQLYAHHITKARVQLQR